MLARVVIDTNLVVQAYTQYPKHLKNNSYPIYYQLVDAFKKEFFTWLWSDDILTEYWETLNDPVYQQQRAKRGGIVRQDLYQQDERLLRFAGKQVIVTSMALSEARRLITSPGRAKSLQDEDDAVFLAVAADGQASYLVSEDKSLTSMGTEYKNCSIMVWWKMLQRLGYPVIAEF